MASYWAVAQTVSKMEHIVRRDIEKTNHGTFVPTCARFWQVDGRDYSRERPLFVGYVFFRTQADDWAGIPDIHGVYDVLSGPEYVGGEERVAGRISDEEMERMVIGHANGSHNETLPPRYTKYFTGIKSPAKRKSSRKPRPGNRLRNSHVA
jgi:transcription antitermination factor NusG